MLKREANIIVRGPSAACALAVLLAAPAGGEAAAWSGAQGPVFTGTLVPCCDVPDAAMEAPAWAAVSQEMPRHQFFDEATRRTLKADALFNPAVPAGVDVGVAEFGGLAVEAGPQPRAANIGTRFEGLDILDGGGWIPPDTIVAVSEAKVLEAVNVALRLSLRGGAAPLTQSFQEFFQQSPTAFLFDPKVYFDRLSGRFFVIILSVSDAPQQSFIHLAVSRGSNPDGLGADDWCKYKINALREGSWADYPGLGMNENWVAVSVNNFSFAGDGGFNSAFIHAIPKTALVNNTQSCPAVTLRGFRPATDAQGATAFTVQPAQHYTTNGLAGEPLFFVSAQLLLGGSSSYGVWRLSGEGAAATLTKLNVSGAFEYAVPPTAPQLGGDDLDTGDTRITQAAFRDGSLWAVHGTACAIGEAPNESCVRAVEFTPTDAGASIAFQQTFGSSDWYGFWPGIAINERGDVVAPFQRSRADRFLDTAYSGKLAAAAIFDPIRTFKLGSCTLFNDPLDTGVNRTGDFVGAQTDPLDDLGFYVAGEFTGPVSIFGCNWRTWVGRLSFPAAPAASGLPPADSPGNAPGSGDGGGTPPATGREPIRDLPTRDVAPLRPDFEPPY